MTGLSRKKNAKCCLNSSILYTSMASLGEQRAMATQLRADQHAARFGGSASLGLNNSDFLGLAPEDENLTTLESEDDLVDRYLDGGDDGNPWTLPPSAFNAETQRLRVAQGIGAPDTFDESTANLLDPESDDEMTFGEELDAADEADDAEAAQDVERRANAAAEAQEEDDFKKEKREFIMRFTGNSGNAGDSIGAAGFTVFLVTGLWYLGRLVCTIFVSDYRQDIVWQNFPHYTFKKPADCAYGLAYFFALLLLGSAGLALFFGIISIIYIQVTNVISIIEFVS